VILSVSFFIFFKSEAKQCISNPFTYGAGKMGNVYCSCSQQTNSLCPAKFSFNDTTFTAGVTKCGTQKAEDIEFDFIFNP